jgi:flagellin
MTFSKATDGTKLTTDDIGKSISYTVTWKDADGNEKTTTANLTFMGKGDGTVSDIDVAASAKENYFVDDRGTKYYLENKKLTTTQIQDGIKAGLENDEEFSSNFKIENSSGKFTFSNKTNGTDTATIVGGASDANFTDTALNDTLRKDKVAGGETAKVDQYAKDSYQKFNAADDIKAATSTSDKADIESKTFEIDGSKFLVVDSSWTSDQTKTLDPDINVFQLEGTTFDADDDGKDLAALIQKQTGRVTEFKSDDNDTEGIEANDIIFKDADNRLKTQGNELTLQIGDTPEKFQQVGVKIQDMSSKGLGLTGLDLSNQEGAAKAIDTIQNAVNAVSTQRGQLGALQNRLDHTLNSLDATTQNITAAESQIRDVDMAKEMTQYSKNNILIQAAQSMLAQANSLPQGVLSLLQ